MPDDTHPPGPPEMEGDGWALKSSTNVRGRFRKTRCRRSPDAGSGILPLAWILAATWAGALSAEPPVSWTREIRPLFQRSCDGCHNPNKLKGGVDTSSFAGFAKPGKHGPNYAPGDPAASRVIDELSGSEPSMPKEGDPLAAHEIRLIERWIREGARDDTPAVSEPAKQGSARRYTIPPSVTSMAVSPDGKLIAIPGRSEVFLYDSKELDLVRRLAGASPRVESLAFSPDGSRLAGCGGAPGRWGELQVWNVATGTNELTTRLANDCLAGISWSPDGSRVALGGADKALRIVSILNPSERIFAENHTDWVSGTAWLTNGVQLVSSSRDRALKLIDAASGRVIEDINRPVEAIACMARHPTGDLIASGGVDGGLRIYRPREGLERTSNNSDVCLVRELERLPGAIATLAWSPDGILLAAAGTTGEVRLYKAADGTRVAAFGTGGKAVFAVAFSADGSELLSAGSDGLVRVYDAREKMLTSVFTAAPMAW